MGRFDRTVSLVGDISALRESRVIVFGVGGVGGHVCEALVRGGIGTLVFCDGDKVSESNLNRQLVALGSTIGEYKAEVMRARAEDINPDGSFSSEIKYLTPENIEEFELKKYDYVADCIDDVSAKIALAEYAEKHGIRLISCMATGNKLEPTGFKVADIYQTKGCPLCRVMRSELRKRNIKGLTVVYSEEEPKKRLSPPASISFVPAAAGMVLASKIIKDLFPLTGTRRRCE